MNSRFTFVICCVLICDIIFCSDAATAGRSVSESETVHECAGIYLSSKGKLEYDAPSGKDSSMCIPNMQQLINGIREEFEKILKKDLLANETLCVMTDFDQMEVVDLVIKIGFYLTYVTLPETEKETHVASIANEGEKLRNTTSTTCGIEDDKLKTLVNKFLRKLEPPRSM